MIARRDSCVLRYVASLEDGRVDVSLRAVPEADPLARSGLGYQRMQVFSKFYSAKPLLVQAGGTDTPAVMATALVADVTDLSVTGTTRAAAAAVTAGWSRP